MAAGYLESTVLSGAGGELIHDMRNFAYNDLDDPAYPRFLNFSGSGSRTHRLKGRVLVGDPLFSAVPGWLGVVVENDAGGATGSGPWDIELEADRMPDTAAGVYSQFGAGNLLEAGTAQIRFTVNGWGRRQQVITPVTINAGHRGWHFYVTSATTLTLQSIAVLGPYFECWIHAIGVAATVAGIPPSSLTLASGESALVSVQGASFRFSRLTG